jgi:hypothetical protein
MSHENTQQQQNNLPEMSTAKRLLGATVATILVVWWGIHLNSLIQAVAAACDTQLTVPGGIHKLGGMDVTADIAVLMVYGIGTVIVFCAASLVLPTFALVPRRSWFWRLPVLLVLGSSLPVCVIIVEAISGASRSADRWTDAGFNHLVMDTAGYLFLGVTFGFVAWLVSKIYMFRRWALLAWMGFGFAAIAVPCSLVALSFHAPDGSGSPSFFSVLLIRLPVLGIVPWPLIDTFLCLVGAVLVGIGWFLLKRNSIAPQPLQG